ncbi:unnamed protein product [Medioppia subpectinata]|uniref:Uncharacterized protein n=1 Tax=Medioppia subpectinata TaxID=1979941 RepID=A0A7R9KL84_9ACAR|nr:unnamed protein product [Medioppia subpectinata]CAG2105514.1 unnamed protein product [Medioppia subpectinata]
MYSVVQRCFAEAMYHNRNGLSDQLYIELFDILYDLSEKLVHKISAFKERSIDLKRDVFDVIANPLVLS